MPRINVICPLVIIMGMIAKVITILTLLPLPALAEGYQAVMQSEVFAQKGGGYHQ